MANNYTLFSMAIDGVTKLEREWLEQFQHGDIPEEYANEADTLQHLCTFDIAFIADNYNPVIPKGAKTCACWMCAEENGDVEALAALLQLFLKRWRPDDPGIRFSWAETCSDPRIGEFGGGHALVTADEIRFCTGDCFDRR